MENLYWRESQQPESEYRVPDDVFDLLFRLRGEQIEIDHAFALAEALHAQLGKATFDRIGVHGVRLADSGNGWTRSEQGSDEIPLPRRARLVIRLHRDDHDAVTALSGQTLQLGSQRLEVGTSSERKLSPLACLHARAVHCDPGQTETEFLAQAASEMQCLGIDVARMICGRSGAIRTGRETLFTRALLVADLKPEESVRLQQRGLGGKRGLGCGLFVPHRGIDAVYRAQE